MEVVGKKIDKICYYVKLFKILKYIKGKLILKDISIRKINLNEMKYY